MTNKEVNTYLLVDSGTRVLYASDLRFEVASFGARSVLDTKAIGIPRSVWKSASERNVQLTRFQPAHTYKGGAFELAPLELITEEVVAKARKVDLYLEAFRSLLWFANQTVEDGWFTPALSMDELPIALSDLNGFVLKYSLATGIPYTEASKEVQFCISSLTILFDRRKQLMWKYEPLISKITNQETLKQFKDQVADAVVNIGTV